MKATRRHWMVLVTVPSRRVARALARKALESRAAACANIIPALESHYWWKGRIEKASELLILFKTDRRRLPALEKVVHEHHPYDTPEFVAQPLEWGSDRYLAWLDASLKTSP